MTFHRCHACGCETAPITANLGAGVPLTCYARIVGGKWIQGCDYPNAPDTQRFIADVLIWKSDQVANEAQVQEASEVQSDTQAKVDVRGLHADVVAIAQRQDGGSAPSEDGSRSSEKAPEDDASTGGPVG